MDDQTQILCEQLNCSLQAKRLHLEMLNYSNSELSTYEIEQFPDDLFSHSFYITVKANNDLIEHGIHKLCVSVISYQPTVDDLNIQLTFFDNDGILSNNSKFRVRDYYDVQAMIDDLEKISCGGSSNRD